MKKKRIRIHADTERITNKTTEEKIVIIKETSEMADL